MSYSTLTGDADFIREYDTLYFQSYSDSDLLNLYKDKAKLELKNDLINQLSLINNTSSDTVIDDLVTNYETQLKRSLSLQQLYLIYHNLGGEIDSLNYLRKKELKQLYESEFKVWKQFSIAVTTQNIGVMNRL